MTALGWAWYELMEAEYQLHNAPTLREWEPAYHRYTSAVRAYHRTTEAATHASEAAGNAAVID